ncbi:DUF1592 domain-containing protein [Limnoglobus roseus]|uniref:Cytochrome c domain-containing protein n=1 Tax=Limnoglobus roseus TaxID=2598579 RepID=A0A5C1AAX5_9BACT|nr:DUF1592 domain-containing protein [Limnoglobus roseus]QEL14972.1 hypothetical protein PX52LOC_01877 [Limnoglobus roseus]
MATGRLLPTTLLLAALVGLARFAPEGVADPPPAIPAASGPSFMGDVRPFLAKHCFSCHGNGKARGDVTLDAVKDEEALRKDRKLWDGVLRTIRDGEMPPKDRPRPTAGETDAFAAALDGVLARIDCSGARNPGRVTIRRLNRVEYTNTVRDLLHLKDFQAADDFPADDSGYGFDNNGDVLTVSPLLLEKYLTAAEKAVDAATRDKAARGKLLAPADKIKETFYNKQERAKIILEAFAPRAYRRPVAADEIDRLMKFVRLSLVQDGESGDRAAFLAMRAVLVSPRFLFRVELDRAPRAGGTQLNDFELASRLSYFLWASMPDDDLFQLAREKKLRENDVLESQVRRMLKDAKARALTDNFAGQWLELRAVKQVRPDPKRFPDFTEPLQKAMVEETERFFAHVVSEDRSVIDFIDADYTFVNDVLAKHYGLSGVTGSEFRRVKLPADQRGGLLTHASILTLTSTPTRTSPVKRGKWILENILNTPPPPPPPDVPELERDGKELTGPVREVLAKHRADANCATCHNRIDPLGLALENYDAVGAWRTKDGKADIDAGGELPNGKKFRGASGLRDVLKAKEAEFRRCLAEKLLTYALGRGLESYDRCAVDEIAAAVARDGNRFSALAAAVVKSEPFRYRNGRASNERAK